MEAAKKKNSLFSSITKSMAGMFSSKKKGTEVDLGKKGGVRYDPVTKRYIFSDDDGEEEEEAPAPPPKIIQNSNKDQPKIDLLRVLGLSCKHLAATGSRRRQSVASFI